METSQPTLKGNPLWTHLFTWIVVLLVSDLPNAIWGGLIGEPPAWFFWGKVGLLGVLIVISPGWKVIQPVRSFFILLVVLLLALWGMNWIRGTAAYIRWENQAGWVIAMAGYQLLKIAVVLVLIGVLLLMGRQRKEFFLTRGQLNTPLKPGNSQGPLAKRSISWGTLGLLLGLCIAPLTLLFFGLGNLPQASILIKALPFFPAVLLFAATNAFAEEMQFRASLLGDLQKVIGSDQAIWLTATFFGFAHYFGGAPSGLPGVLIAGLLGALFAKCMLGSKGIVVPWFVHFCQNAVIYAFWALNSVS